MPFACKDCTYRGATTGKAGECLACGSHNIENRPYVERVEKTPSRWRIALLIALWTYLIATIIWKLVN
jgi:hypothetical protein